MRLLVVNSTEIFKVSATLDGQLWNLVGGAVSLILVDPNGSVTTIVSSNLYNGGATVNWTVAGPAGNWTRSWDVTDSTGIRQVSPPIQFAVGAYP